MLKTTLCLLLLLLYLFLPFLLLPVLLLFNLFTDIPESWNMSFSIPWAKLQFYRTINCWDFVIRQRKHFNHRHEIKNRRIEKDEIIFPLIHKIPPMTSRTRRLFAQCAIPAQITCRARRKLTPKGVTLKKQEVGCTVNLSVRYAIRSVLCIYPRRRPTCLPTVSVCLSVCTADVYSMCTLRWEERVDESPSQG